MKHHVTWTLNDVNLNIILKNLTSKTKIMYMPPRYFLYEHPRIK